MKQQLKQCVIFVESDDGGNDVRQANIETSINDNITEHSADVVGMKEGKNKLLIGNCLLTSTHP